MQARHRRALRMLLYHFSKMYFLQRGGTILREGLKPPENNNVQLDALVDGVVWFTSDPNPLGMFAKPWDRSDCRITCVIPVRDKRLMHWPQWLRKNLSPDQHQQAIALNEQSGTPWRSYWIYFGAVPRDYLRAVEYADPNLRAQASAERQRDRSKFMNPS